MKSAASAHDVEITRRLTREWNININYGSISHGFNWRTGTCQPDLSSTPPERFVRDSDQGLARTALLTVPMAAATASAAGVEFRSPNRFNEIDDPYLHAWVGFADGTEESQFTNPEHIRRITAAFFSNPENFAAFYSNLEDFAASQNDPSSHRPPSGLGNPSRPAADSRKGATSRKNTGSSQGAAAGSPDQSNSDSDQSPEQTDGMDTDSKGNDRDSADMSSSSEES